MRVNTRDRNLSNRTVGSETHNRKKEPKHRTCDQFVCLSICLSASISLESLDRSKRNFVQILCGSGSVLLWRRCDTLSTSGFIDDVTFRRSGPYGNAWKAEPLTYYH